MVAAAQEALHNQETHKYPRQKGIYINLFAYCHAKIISHLTVPIM
jgi:hypothetical protein